MPSFKTSKENENRRPYSVNSQDDGEFIIEYDFCVIFELFIKKIHSNNDFNFNFNFNIFEQCSIIIFMLILNLYEHNYTEKNNNNHMSDVSNINTITRY